VGQGKLGSASSGKWEVGGQIGHYTVLDTIGAGGMGRVYQAKDPAGRVVAIKTISGADPELVLRFQREAEALATVDAHPAVVRIHTAGTHAGRPYLVMDYLSGGSLHDKLETDGPLAPEEAAWVVREVAQGIAHVHQHGILHRDLKPHNVLLDEDSGPHVADFGLARVQDAQGLTRSGSMLGTIGYMSPEQALGESDKVDARTDVYGLGGILFCALTGRAPFVGKAHEAVKAVVEGQAPSPRALVASVPPALDAICRRALARRPDHRPPSAEALAAELDAFLANPGGGDDGVRSHLPLLVTLGGVVLLLSAAVVIALAARMRTASAPAASPTPVASDPTPAATPTSPAPATPESAPDTPRVDPSQHPSGDCLRLALQLRERRSPPERADLIDAEAFLLRAVAEGEPLADVHLGLVQLELGHDKAGIDTLWQEFERDPVLLPASGGAIDPLRLTGRLSLVLALLEGRYGEPLDVRRGLGVWEGGGRDLHSMRITTGALPELDVDRLRAVSARDDVVPIVIFFCRKKPGDLALHSEQMDELVDLAEDLDDDGKDPSGPLRLLETAAEDGIDDPFAWFHLAEWYDDNDRDGPRSLELYLRCIDLEGFPHVRNEARREAAEALYYGPKEGVAQDLERARALLDEETLRRNSRAPELLEKIERKLAKQASGDR
jgi:serine/threonine protein kinase